MKKTVGDNLKIYRLRAKLSMAEAGKRMSISAPAILKFESNKIIASLQKLEDFARIYNTTVEAILETDDSLDIKFSNLKFQNKISSVNKERIINILENKINNYFAVLNFANITLKNKFGVHAINSVKEAESLATQLRIFFTLPIDQPIYNLINLLENHEMMIITIPRNNTTKDFIGFYEIINNVPVIAVLESDNGYEQRFNIAKYLGELLILANRNKNVLTTTFALSLLIPKSALFKEFDEKRVKINFREIEVFSNVYKVSYKNVVTRLLGCAVISPSGAKYMKIFINKNNIKETDYYEEPYNFNKYLYQMLAKGVIKDEKKYLE